MIGLWDAMSRFSDGMSIYQEKTIYTRKQLAAAELSLATDEKKV